MEKEQNQTDALSVSELKYISHLLLFQYIYLWKIKQNKLIVIHVTSWNILICISVSLTDCCTIMLTDVVCSSQMNGEVNNHPPDAKKAKMRVKHVVLPIEETFTQQLPKDCISTYMEQEVLLTKC